MVDGRMYFKINGLKAKKLSERKIANQLQIDRSTVKKYASMSGEEYLQYSLESKTRRALDPYREIITDMSITQCPHRSSMKLLEGDKDFSPSKRSVRQPLDCVMNWVFQHKLR